MDSRHNEVVKYYLRNYFMSSDIFKLSTDQLLDISAIEINLVLGPFDVKRRGNRYKPCLHECEVGMIDIVKKYCRYQPRPVADRNHSKPESIGEKAQNNQPITKDVFSSENT